MTPKGGAGPGRARNRRPAHRAAPRQAHRTARRRARPRHLRTRRRPARGDRAQARAVVRGHLGRRGAPIPRRPLPGTRRRPGPDGARAVRARGIAPQGAPAHEPVGPAAAQPPRSLRMIAVVAALVAASASPLRAAREPAAVTSREDSERAYRASIRRHPARWQAYAGLASLLAAQDDRWERADETLALLGRGLSLAPPPARVPLSIAVADFERSVGRTPQARDRLSALTELKPDASQSRRIRELLDRIVDEERARAVEDWPDPMPSPTQRAELAAAEQKLLANDARSALATADSLCAALPAWRSARWVRARALEAVGRVDEEARELRILTQLSPSHAEAWRRLGEILAAEGGLLEADRADEALRQAPSLEASWTGLWVRPARGRPAPGAPCAGAGCGPRGARGTAIRARAARARSLPPGPHRPGHRPDSIRRRA